MIKLERNEFMKVIRTQEKPKVDINESITKLVNNIKKNAQNYVSDTQYYRPVDESMRNESDKLFCKAYSLSVEQNPDNTGRHFLSLNMLHPKMRIQTSRTLAAGNKQEILEFLNKEDINKLIKTNLSEMSENLQEK